MKHTRDTYVICYEGEAEMTIFGFLKKKFCLENKTFKQENIGGFNSFSIFQRKYNKIIKKWGLKQNNLKNKVHFFFLIDKDLDDSDKIKKFISGNGHTVQFCNPNIESVLLKMSGVNITQEETLQEFRSKCKEKFKQKFGKEAHRMTDLELSSIIKDEKDFKGNFLEIFNLFN